MTLPWSVKTRGRILTSSARPPRHASLPTLVIFQAATSPRDTPLERLLSQAQNASTLDTIRVAASSHAFNRAVLVTEDADLTASASALAAELAGLLPLTAQAAPLPATTGASFNFGENLRSVCKSHNLERVVYIGGGAMPLATPATLADLALPASGSAPCVVSNNLYSADIVAFYPASALNHIDPPANDNDLAWLLHYKAGLPYAPTTKTLATNFDIDTPTDLATLHLATQSPPLDAALGPHLRDLLQRVSAEMPALADSLQRAYKVMATRRAQVLLAGRVSSWTWRRLETNLPCQTRIFAEERGMRASGREARGEVRSLLGLYADLAGNRWPHLRPRTDLRRRLPRHPRPLRPPPPLPHPPRPFRLRRPPPRPNLRPLDKRANSRSRQRKNPHRARRPLPHLRRPLGNLRACARVSLRCRNLMQGYMTFIAYGSQPFSLSLNRVTLLMDGSGKIPKNYNDDIWLVTSCGSIWVTIARRP